MSGVTRKCITNNNNDENVKRNIDVILILDIMKETY